MERWSARGIVLVLVLAALGVGPGAAAPAGLDERERLWLVGERAQADGLHPLARAVLERFVGRYPDDARVPAGWLLLGKACLAGAALDCALDAFRRAQAFVPVPGQPEEARFWEGETLFRMKRYEEAGQVLDRLLSDNAASPFAPDALYGLGWASVELQRREGAIIAFRQLLDAFPGHAAVPSATVALARQQLELKRFDEAIALLRPFPERYPGHQLLPEARYLLGYARVSAGETEGGLADLRAFVQAHPDHELVPQARRLVTESLVRGGRKEEIVEEYRRLMAQFPRTAESLYDAGLLATQIKQTKDADLAWTALRTEFPEHALSARASLELARGAFARSQFRDAAALATAAARSEEAAVRVPAGVLLGEAELKQKRYAAALAAFGAVAETPEADPALLYRALAGSGLALEQQKRWAEAARHYERVAAESPDRELRAWAKTRREEVVSHLRPAATPKPPAKPPATGRQRKQP